MQDLEIELADLKQIMKLMNDELNSQGDKQETLDEWISVIFTQLKHLQEDNLRLKTRMKMIEHPELFTKKEN